LDSSNCYSKYGEFVFIFNNNYARSISAAFGSFCTGMYIISLSLNYAYISDK